MKLNPIWCALFTILIAGCKSLEGSMQSNDREPTVTSSTQTRSLPTGQITPTAASLTPLPEPTITKTITATPSDSPSLPSPEITPTLTVTPTTSISNTFLITNTWVYTDIQVTRSGKINQVTWSRNGSYLAAATSVGVFLYNNAPLELEHIFNVGENIPSAAFSPDDDLLVYGSMKGDIQWIDPLGGLYIAAFGGHQLGITDLAFPTRSLFLVSGSDDGSVRVWDPALVYRSGVIDFLPSVVIQVKNRVTGVDINQNLQMVAAGSYQTWYVWDWATGELRFEFGGLSDWISDIAFSPGGDLIAVADSRSTIRIWNTATWELVYSVQFDQMDGITSLDFSRDGVLLALAGDNGKVLLWDLVENVLFEFVETYPHRITDIEFHPGREIFLTCYDNGFVRFWSKQPL